MSISFINIVDELRNRERHWSVWKRLLECSWPVIVVQGSKCSRQNSSVVRRLWWGCWLHEYVTFVVQQAKAMCFKINLSTSHVCSWYFIAFLTEITTQWLSSKKGEKAQDDLKLKKNLKPEMNSSKRNKQFSCVDQPRSFYQVSLLKNCSFTGISQIENWWHLLCLKSRSWAAWYA